MKPLMFDLTPLFHIDFIQAALIVTFAVAGTYALGSIAVMLILKGDR